MQNFQIIGLEGQQGINSFSPAVDPFYNADAVYDKEPDSLIPTCAGYNQLSDADRIKVKKEVIKKAKRGECNLLFDYDCKDKAEQFVNAEWDRKFNQVCPNENPLTINKIPLKGNGQVSTNPVDYREPDNIVRTNNNVGTTVPTYNPNIIDVFGQLVTNKPLGVNTTTGTTANTGKLPTGTGKTPVIVATNTKPDTNIKLNNIEPVVKSNKALYWGIGLTLGATVIGLVIWGISRSRSVKPAIA